MKYEVRDEAAFVRQLATHLIPHGYWFYVTGVVPQKKDPDQICERLAHKYQVHRCDSKDERFRRKKRGLANLRMFRWRRFWILIATDGEHWFFEREPVKDLRGGPMLFCGYSIRSKQSPTTGRWHSVVRIRPAEYQRLLDEFRQKARKTSKKQLIWDIRKIPFEPYAGVKGQLAKLVWLVNRERLKGGRSDRVKHDLLPLNCYRKRLRRAPVFEQEFDGEERISDVPDEKLWRAL